MNFAIAAALTEEAGQLSELAFRSKAHWGYPPEWLDEWRAQLTISADVLEEQIVFVARRGRVPIGFYALLIHGQRASLEHLWVDPAAQGGGVGAALFRHAKSEARKRGCETLRIDSDPHAEGFYLRMGAVRTGTVAAPVAGLPRELPRLSCELREG